MSDDLERLSRLLDDLAMERDPADRHALSPDEVEMAEAATFLKAADTGRGNPDDAFVDRLGAHLAATRAAPVDRAPDTTTTREHGVSRRGLIGRVAAVAAGLIVGAGAGDALRGQSDEAAASAPYKTPMVPESHGRWIDLHRQVSAIAPGRAVRFRVGAVEGFLVNPGESRPLYALSASCTHMGCMLSWLDSAGSFLCPCHGAQYNADGTVLTGIARHPLPPLRLRVDPDGGLYVWGVDEHASTTVPTLYPSS